MSVAVHQWPSIADIAAQVADGSVTARENVEKALQLIAETNEEYNCIIATTEKRALNRADSIDADIADGKPAGKLAGVPFIAKDNYLAFGAETTAGSNILKGFTAPYQSTVIERLEAEGAICVAKANLDAFAHGGSTENSDFGVTKNPHDISRVPGGSSGGSAAAMALGLTPFTLGSDTGGSIRQPASFCGVVGFKPSYGRTSRSGVVAMASSTDVMGPLTSTIADSELVMSVIAGDDPLDSTTMTSEFTVQEQATLKGKTVGVIKEYFASGLDAGVRTQVEEAIDRMKAAGATIKEVSLPTLDAALAVYYIVVPAELSSNLARHDGQRFEFSAKDASSLEESYTKTRSHGFGAEAKRRIMIGTHVLSSGYYDAYYRKAQLVRAKIIKEFAEAFESVDMLVGPVAPTTAFKIGENEDPLSMYLQDVMTVGVSLAGLPAISLPCGMSSSLPVGLQVIGKYGDDAGVLAFSRACEELEGAA